MNRRFEEFTGRGAHVPSDAPRVTLQKNGKMGLNHAALDLLGHPEAVVLLFDEGSRTVGLRPSTRDVEHSYPLGKHSATSRVFSISAFAKYYGIALESTRSFVPALEDGVLVFELDKGVPHGRRRVR